jgi:choline kinase
MTRTAVVLAAGIGSRLRPLTATRPKALVPLAGRPLVDHVLDVLAAGGIDSVVVVVGYEATRLADHLAARRDLRIACVENAAFASTNTLASLAAAARLVGDAFLLIDGDLVFEPAVLASILGDGTRLAVDRGPVLDDDAVKVAVGGGRITHVGKTLPPGILGVGESIGLARVDRETAAALFPLCRRLLASGARGAYYEAAFQTLIDGGARFVAADVTGLRWVEVDDHEDFRRAEALFAAA